MTEAEFDKLIAAITNIREESETKFDGFSTIYFPELGSSLITLVDIDEEHMTSPEMTIMGLKILRKLIEFENKNPKV